MIIRFLQDVIDYGITAFGLFVFALLAGVGEAGFLVGTWRSRRRPPPEREMTGVSTVTAGMLGLVGFLLALTISFSQDRYEARRHSTVEQANAIGTAWLRAGLTGSGKPIAMLIEEYARTQLAYLNAAAPDLQAAAVRRTNELQNQIWQEVLSVLNTMRPRLAASFVNSVNDMFDASLVQRYALESRAPTETSLMLLTGAMLTVGALGYQLGLGGQRRPAFAAAADHAKRRNDNRGRS